MLSLEQLIIKTGDKFIIGLIFSIPAHLKTRSQLFGNTPVIDLI